MTTTDTVTTAAAPEEPPPSPSPPSPPEGTRNYRIGDAITLSGNSEGTKMAVKLLAIQDPFVPTAAYASQPDRGERFVAVKIALRNVGTLVYDDSPSNGSVLIDSQDQPYSDTAFETREPGIGSPTITPGDRRVGWMTFQIGKRARLKKFQFTLESGFGPEAGEWLLGPSR